MQKKKRWNYYFLIHFYSIISLSTGRFKSGLCPTCNDLIRSGGKLPDPQPTCKGIRFDISGKPWVVVSFRRSRKLSKKEEEEQDLVRSSKILPNLAKILLDLERFPPNLVKNSHDLMNFAKSSCVGHQNPLNLAGKVARMGRNCQIYLVFWLDRIAQVLGEEIHNQPV